MVEILQSCFFVLSGLLLSLIVIEKRKALFIFRAIGLISSVSIIFAYHYNWLFHQPMTLLSLSVFFCALSITFIFFRKIKVSELVSLFKGIEFKNVLLIIGALFVPMIIGVIYFQGQLDVPRYATPDSGTHYLYMSQTARTGFVPLFSPSEIYPASGNLEVFKLHHESYLPGSVVLFFVIDKLMNAENPTVAFQSFNIFWYAMLSLYFLFIFRSRGYLNSIAATVVASAFIFFGTFFDFVVTSYSAQLFGLFLLIYFLDTFHDFIEKKESFLLPMLSLAAIGMTYVYWLPVAGIFVASSVIFSLNREDFRKNGEMLINVFQLLIGSLLFGAGYLMVLLRINMLSHAVDDGGFSFQGQILSDAIIIAPIVSLCLVFVTFYYWKNRKNDFLLNVSISVLVYALTLFFLYEKNLVSHYAAIKVMYLLVPMAWIIFISLLDKFESRFLDFNFIKAQFCKKEFIIGSVLLFMFSVIFYGYAYGSKWISFEITPLEMKNFELIFDEKRDPVITREQLELLDVVKREHAWVLQEGRLVIIAPPNAALWSFAYSGIWPRTLNLIDQSIVNDSNGVLSPMNIYSPNIIDYDFWLSREGEHVLMFFDTGESDKWAKRVKFNLADYEVLAREGKNMLLKLKNN